MFVSLSHSQCYEVYLATKNLQPDLHVKVVDETSVDYVVECVFREDHCFEIVGSRDFGATKGICRESESNTREKLFELNKHNYGNLSATQVSLENTIIIKGTRWYVMKEIFREYYLQCKEHRQNIYLKLEEMLEREKMSNV